ncbi:MAG: hypothetical protein HRT98_00370 [Mycoplasmatales bacterium]|nr:hypothetical protein [Mycoplasmatales bacterium]
MKKNYKNYLMRKMITNTFKLILIFTFSWIFYKKKNNKIKIICMDTAWKHNDNGKFLFDEIKDQSKMEVFYVMEDKTNKQFLKYGSWRYIWHTTTADIVATSNIETSTPIYPSVYKKIKFFRQPKILFLQHGVTDKNSKGASIDKMKSYIDFIVSTFEFETQHFLDLGYSKEQIIEVGMPRYFNILKNESKNNTFLFMPSWNRNGEKFDFEFWIDLINKIREKGFNVKLLPHHQLITQWNERKVDFEMLSPLKTNYKKEITNSNYIVSDESSVLWDGLFYGTTPIFVETNSKTHFIVDRNNYMENFKNFPFIKEKQEKKKIESKNIVLFLESIRGKNE